MSYAAIDSKLVLARCSIEREDWKRWLEEVNGEWEDKRQKLIKKWEDGGWFYRLMFAHPDTPKSSFDNYQFKLNRMHYGDMIKRIESLEALAIKSVDGTVLLSAKDAKFLNINE